MELVKLKMKPIYKSFLIIIFLLIMISLMFGILYFIKNNNQGSKTDIEVNGNLSINYIDGNVFDVLNKNVLKFSITNNSECVNYYTIIFSKIKGDGTYKLLSNDLIINEGNLNSNNEAKIDDMSIDPKETIIYQLEINSNSNLKGKIDINNVEEKNDAFADLILKTTPPVNSPMTKVGSEIATLNEGLIKSADDNGVTYYYRGDIQNNYVSLGNLIWRIVRINSDKTVRLILDGETSTIASYYTSSNPSFKFESSNMKFILDNWFNENLKNYEDIIANSNYCNDISNDNNVYSSNTRILTNKLPVLACLGTTIKNKIGLLTIDEVLLAGASVNNSNEKFYLYNSNISKEWYTLSAVSGNDNSINMFMINTNGSINTNVVGNLNRSIRPVINLEKNIKMIGDGTAENPYILLNNINYNE